MTNDRIPTRGARGARRNCPTALRSAALLALALASSAASGVGCGSNDVGVVSLSPGQTLTENGWRSFSAGDAIEARELFEDAAVLDSAYADAENGLGWVDLFFGLFTAADAHFARAIELGLASQEAEAGHALVAELRGDAVEALAATARVLAADPRFVFSRRPGVDFRDLHLVRARSFFPGGRFAEAKAEVDAIDPSNAVDENATTFIADLLAEIERLGDDLYDF